MTAETLTSPGSVPGEVPEQEQRKERVAAVVARRLLRAVLVAWGVSLVAFALVRIIPGDPVAVLLGDLASEDRIQRLREDLHLTGSVFNQYFSYMSDLVRLDFGRSIMTTRPVLTGVGDTLPVTLWLTGLGMLVALVIALPLGVIGGLTRSNLYRLGFNLVSSALIATPVFVSGVLLLLPFAVWLRWVPVGGYVYSFPQNIYYLILPAVVTGIPIGMIFGRVLQESIRETYAEEFVETGLVWGIGKTAFMWRYLVRPSIAPVIGLLGYIVGAYLAAAVVVETVFVLPGIGTYLVRGVLARDYPVVQGTLFIFGFIVVAVHFLADALSAVIDPRARVMT